jgi:hypothetical protein
MGLHFRKYALLDFSDKEFLRFDSLPLARANRVAVGGTDCLYRVSKSTRAESWTNFAFPTAICGYLSNFR